MIFFSSSFRAFLGVSETVAFAVGLDDVDAVGESVEECAGESLVAEDLGPLLEGEVGRHQNALPFVGTAEHLEEQLGAGLGEGHVAELIENEQMLFLDAFEETFELPLFARFEKLGDESGHGEEAYVFALAARGVSEVRVSIRRCAHHPLLLASGALDTQPAIPW